MNKDCSAVQEVKKLWRKGGDALRRIGGEIGRPQRWAAARRHAQAAGAWIRRKSAAFDTKRAFDIVVGVLMFAAFLPVMAVLAVMVRRKLGTPVLFRQVRPGRHGVPFELMKFRTMSDERDANGDLLPDSERLPAFGLWLRSTSLDELPELINVIRGDMSLVGPRPLLMEYLPLYSDRQARRHEVRPGLTGWAQVNGRNAVDWPERLEMDVWYVENRTLWLDCQILWKTVEAVALRRGVSQDGHATMEKFRGEATGTEGGS